MRWLIRAILAIVLLGVVLIGAVFLLPADKIASLASDQIRKATGRELTLGGRLKPSVWPQIGVSTGTVSISNADWASDQPLLQAEALEIGLDVMALIGGDIVIRKITATSPAILLETAADGRVNWDVSQKDPATGSNAGGSSAPASDSGGLTLDLAQITGASVTYIDHGAGITHKLSDVDATVQLPDFNGPADMALQGVLNGQSFRADLSLARFSDQLSGVPAATKVSAKIGGSGIRFEGTAALSPLSVKGALDADMGDLPAVMAAVGQAAPAPSPFTQNLQASGDITLGADGAIGLQNGTFRFGVNTLSGNATLTTSGQKPRLVGQLAAGTLDLRTGAAGSGGGGGGGKAKKSKGWSTEPIDVSALGALDAEVALSADKLLLDDASLGAARLVATLTDRRLVLELHELGAYRGQVTGQVVVNGRGGLSVAGDLNVAGVALRPALNELADYDRLSSTADLRMKFLGSGASMAAIMSSLSGDGSLNLGQGEFRGLDLAAIFLRKAEGADDDARTLFSDVTGSFTIKNGVLRNKDMRLASDRFSATGAGQINLGKQTMDYRLVPQTLIGSEELRIPLRIVGAWSDPSLRLDLDAVMDKRKDEVKEDLGQKAAEKLGVQTQEGESAEDAAKRKLEKKAKKALKNLLK